ncbi:MAG TPA: hypothetical protein VEX41_10855 [Candidatus Eisenbacteria bacterium]|nr:hypothetical protein [Candidatus Eisenbacteria bacterium]
MTRTLYRKTTLLEGGPADVFIVHGDPLSDPAALWRAWRVARAG